MLLGFIGLLDHTLPALSDVKWHLNIRSVEINIEPGTYVIWPKLITTLAR